MKYTGMLLISLFFGLSALPATAAVNAWLDRNQAAPGESVRLTLQHDGQTDSQPDLSPLKRDFDILGRSTGSSVQVINGKMSAQVQVSLDLAPKHGGTLLVPALQWDGQLSPALPLTVAANAAGQAGKAPSGRTSHVSVTATLDRNRPYVQAAAILTVRLQVDEPLSQASLDLPPNNDVLVQQLGKDRQTVETHDGRDYQVVERKYALFPQRSGRISLDGPVLNAQVPDTRDAGPIASDPFFGRVFGHNPFGMLSATRPITVRGDPIVLDVRSRPAGSAGQDWLPAENVTLDASWRPQAGPIVAGDPVTLHLRLTARGLTASQLPDMAAWLSLPEGLRAYPDQPGLNTESQGGAIVGTRDQNIALIARTAGRYTIPAMHLSWWDTAKDVQRGIDLPAHTVVVLPGTPALSAATAPPAPPVSPLPGAEPSHASPTSANTGADRRWPWVSAAFAALWLATLYAWWQSARPSRGRPARAPGRPPSGSAATQRAGDARKAFRQACRQNAPVAARRHLLDWARANWPNDPLIGLKGIEERVGDPGLKPLLDQLDRACYAGGEWRGDPLLRALASLSGRDRPGFPAAPELADLYP